MELVLENVWSVGLVLESVVCGVALESLKFVGLVLECVVCGVGIGEFEVCGGDIRVCGLWG